MTDATIQKRHSTRAFLKKQVPQNLLERIVAAGMRGGSFLNIQPWHFAVLSGEALQAVKKNLWEQYLNGEQEEAELNRGPEVLPEQYRMRADGFCRGIDDVMFPEGIDNPEQRRDEYTRSGIILRDAPAVIIVYTEKVFAEVPLHSLAIGGAVQLMTMQAQLCGLGSCIVGRIAESPRLLRSVLDLGEEYAILCGVLLGYEDEFAAINTLNPARVSMEEITTWYGFET